ncbi:MAG: hypothetical protein ACK4M7_02365, partial [Burkholderiales bacterium]
MSDLQQNYGTQLSNIYKGSTFKLLRTIYPSYDWKPWKFTKTGNGFWKSIENQREYLDWFKKEAGIASNDDWYKLTSRDIRKWGGRALLKIYQDSVFKMLQSVYPEIHWLPWRFGRVSRHFWNDK